MQAENQCREAAPLLHHRSRKRNQPRQTNTGKCFPRCKCRLIPIKGKRPISILVWNTLLAIAICVQVVIVAEIPMGNQLLLGAATVILFPIIGWLADVKVGRYRIMQVSLFLVMIVNLLLVGYVLAKQFILERIASDVLLYAGTAATSLVLSCYTSSIQQFVTDQQVEASSEELAFTLYWISWSEIFGIALGCTMICVVIQPTTVMIVQLSVSVASWFVALVVFYKSRHLLVLAPLNPNPIKHITRVVWYAWKHKYPKQRSALTYWEDDYPSRIDLGKSKYGGPFTVEEVEDVKTVLRLLPVISIVSMFVDLSSVEISSGKYINEFTLCEFPFTELIVCAAYVVGLPLYHFIIYPLFYNYIPTILQRLHFGMILVLLYYLAGIAVSLVSEERTLNMTCHLNFYEWKDKVWQNDWCAMPMNSLIAFGTLILLFSCSEFVYAQTPHQIKSLMIQVFAMLCIFFAALGSFVDIPWNVFPQYSIPGCSFYYYLLHTILTFAGFLFFVFIAKKYKLRERDEIVPYHQFAEDFVENDIQQRTAFYLQQELCLNAAN